MEQCFTNGEGADLLVYEVGAAGQGGVSEPFAVFVSSDLITWHTVAIEVENDPGAVFSSIELSPLTGSYRYVKLVDQGLEGGRTPGADIDALEARYAARCTTPESSTLQGLDVNATQGGDIDWPAVYSAGYRFVYVKATSGDADEPTLPNPHLQDQVDGARAAGLAVGVYHFAYPEINSPEDEAEYFLEVAGPYLREGYLRPALDIEEVNGPTSTGIGLSEWIRVWIEAVRATTGVEALLYTTSDYANNVLEPWLADEETGYDLWIAHWKCSLSGSPDCGEWDDRWVFWQYWAPTEPDVVGCPGQRPVPGIAAAVDLDVFAGGMAQLGEYMIPPPDDSLVAFYDFDQAVMTTLLDNSQYSNTGDIQQIEGVVPGKVGNAFSFDGVNDWVKVPDSESLRGITHLEVSCWVKPRSYPPDRIQDWTGIVAYGAENQGMWEVFITHEGAIHFLLNYRTPAETRVTSNRHLDLDTWHHVVCTFDGKDARVYIDGQLAGEAVCSGLLYPGAGSYMAIGLDFPDKDEYFHGLIDELRVYNEVVAP
jgi:GH25 family lysozyme M1 (1,4-beta-N-acetylmuramidase)